MESLGALFLGLILFGIIGLIASVLGYISNSPCKDGRAKAMDVYTLHPGTKAWLDVDTGKFQGYLLPSGRIVYHRYWYCLEGVKAKI